MEQKKTTKCDFYKPEKKEGLLNQLFGETKMTCFVTGTNIPTEHQCSYCNGNFFNCRFFEEWLQARPEIKKVKVEEYVQR